MELYYNICCAIFSTIAFLSNLASFIYIQKSFDTKRCLYFILRSDAMVVMVVTLMASIMFSLVAATTSQQSNSWFCSILFYASQSTALTSPMCNFMISYIRYVKTTKKQQMVFIPLFSRYMKLSQAPNPWLSNEELLKYSLITLSLTIIYGILITFINVYFNLWSFNVYTVCYIGPGATDPKVAFNVITVLIPVIVSVIFSCFMDLSCFVFIHKRNTSVHPRRTQPIPIAQVNSILTEIPLRATIISILLFIPYFLTYIILGIQKLDPLEKYFFVIILTRIQDTLRNPLIAKFLFNINDENRQRNALEERERNQQREIQDALKRRQEARKKCQVVREKATIDSTVPPQGMNLCGC